MKTVKTVQDLLHMSGCDALDWLENNPDYYLIAPDVHESLQDDAHWRCCVEGAGVDNWQGFCFAMEMYEEGQ